MKQMAESQLQKMNKNSLEFIARRVLMVEKQALQDLASAINDDFFKALNLCFECQGRMVIVGMGKSGHVARKIAATLSSTGAPAQFVHPGEASHGDMGMITKQDCVFALSNSGESAELADLIHYCSRFEIPLIAMTKNKESSLGRAANTILHLPDSEEACPMGLAPTSSTTMMMALGDAFAICLLEMKGFNREDFQTFHPGGKLGKMLQRVQDIMHKEDSLPLVSQDDSFSNALLVMTEKAFGCVGVLDQDKRLAGIITDGDLRRHMSPDLLQKQIKDIMTGTPLTIDKKALVSEAITFLNDKKVTSLFVVDEENTPIGLVHLHDCLRLGVK